MRLSSLLRGGCWGGGLLLLGSCGQAVRPPVEDGQPATTGGAGGSSGGEATASGGWFATGGLGGQAPSEREEWLLAAGSPGVFSQENVASSCRVEPEPGVVSGCSEAYYVYEANSPPRCGHLVLGPAQHIWSTDPCPRTGMLGACVKPAKLRVEYYYYYFDETTGVRSLADDCDLKEGWFYEPE